jgi:ESCRT-I complex subunit VPS28
MEIEFTPEEKEFFESEAIVYSIIRTVEVLEKAHLSDKITEDEYNSLCRNLINKYKTLVDSLGSSYPGLEGFLQKYSLSASCKLACKRLQLGITALDAYGTESDRPRTSNIIAVTQCFITANNALQLEMRGVRDLIPILQEVITTLGKVTGVPSSYQGGATIQEWLIKLSKKKVSDELTAEELQELEFDIDQAYRKFKECMGA